MRERRESGRDVQVRMDGLRGGEWGGSLVSSVTEASWKWRGQLPRSLPARAGARGIDGRQHRAGDTCPGAAGAIGVAATAALLLAAASYGGITTTATGRNMNGSVRPSWAASVHVPRTAPCASMAPSQVPVTCVPSSDSSIRKPPFSYSPVTSRTPGPLPATYSPRTLSISPGLAPRRMWIGTSPSMPV